MDPTARDVMTIHPRWVGAATTLVEAAQLMRDLDVGALPVCDDDENLVGMVTDRDIVVRCIADGGDPGAVTAGELATGDPVSIPADAPLDDVLATMADHQIRRLPVIDHGRLVGIISEADIAREGNTEEVADTVQAVTSNDHPA